MEVYEAERLLPKVGAKLKRIPTIVCTNGWTPKDDAQDCEVVEVNRAHLWYRVRFNELGFTECYKVPEVFA